MNVNGKYIKDESGNIISPIASIDTIYNGSNNLKSCLILEKICVVGGSTDGVTVNFNVSDYKWFIANLTYNWTNRNFRVLASEIFSCSDLVQTSSGTDMMVVYGGEPSTFSANICYVNNTTIKIRFNSNSFGGIILYGIKGL